ncbi:MAG: hypothetical protein WCY93_08150 [Anaerolineaceae bacterium]
MKNHANMLADLVFIVIMGGDLITIQPDLPCIGFSKQVDAAQKSAFSSITYLKSKNSLNDLPALVC